MADAFPAVMRGFANFFKAFFFNNTKNKNLQVIASYLVKSYLVKNAIWAFSY